MCVYFSLTPEQSPVTRIKKYYFPPKKSVNLKQNYAILVTNGDIFLLRLIITHMKQKIKLILFLCALSIFSLKSQDRPFQTWAVGKEGFP